MPRPVMYFVDQLGDVGEPRQMRSLRVARRRNYAEALIASSGLTKTHAIEIAAGRTYGDIRHLRRAIAEEKVPPTRHGWLVIQPNKLAEFYGQGAVPSGKTDMDAFIKYVIDNAAKCPLRGWPAIGWAE